MPGVGGVLFICVINNTITTSNRTDTPAIAGFNQPGVTVCISFSTPGVLSASSLSTITVVGVFDSILFVSPFSKPIINSSTWARDEGF